MSQQDGLRINFAEVEDRFGAIPANTYLVTIVKGEVKTSKPESPKYPNCPYINWQLKVKDGDYAGRVVFHINMLHEDFYSNLKETLAACGFDVTGEVAF